MSGVDVIYQLIQDDVKRPDKQAIIRRRIHRSILKMHRKDFWFKDLVEQIYQFDVAGTAAANQQVVLPGAQGLFMNWFGAVNSTLNVQQLDTTNLVRYRKVDYMKKWMTVSPYGTAILDPITGRQGTVQGGELTECSPNNLNDGYGFDRQNVYYGSGTVININSDTPLSQVYIGYLSDPKVNLANTTDATFQDYQSWIADSYPTLICCDVKRFLFSDIGKNEQELKGAQGEYQEELMAFLTSAVNCSTKKG